MKETTLTLDDGTVVHEGDKVRSHGEGTNGLRVCTVLVIEAGRACLTAPTPFGTVWRRRAEIKPHRRKKSHG